MSRTTRRTQKHLIDRWVGSREANHADSWWVMYRYPTCTFEQAYDRCKARYTRDHHSGHYGVPRWYRRRCGSKELRLREQRALHRHWHQDSFDAYSPDNRCRGAGYYWF